MPDSTFNNITCLEMKPSKIVVGLVNGSMAYPYDVVEDVLLKVYKLALLIDFVVIDIKDDDDCPLLLGMPF